jgi:hypothetical protein
VCVCMCVCVYVFMCVCVYVCMCVCVCVLLTLSFNGVVPGAPGRVFSGPLKRSQEVRPLLFSRIRDSNLGQEVSTLNNARAPCRLAYVRSSSCRWGQWRATRSSERPTLEVAEVTTKGEWVSVRVCVCVCVCLCVLVCAYQKQQGTEAEKHWLATC